MSTEVVKKETLSQFLSKNGTQTYLDNVLHDKKDRFITNLVSMQSQNPTLATCTHLSLMSGAIVATSLNLSLNKSFGYAYLVPFENKKQGIIEAQFQIGYKGYIQLAMRTGQYKKLNAVPIYENQFVRWNEVEEELTLNDVDGEGRVVGYSAYFKLQNGFEKKMFWSYEKMLKHADKYSQAFSAHNYKLIQENKIPEKDMWKYSSFWYKSFDDMALKTMLRQLLSKYGILSEEMETAYQSDQAVMHEDKPVYVDSQEDRVVKAEIVTQQDIPHDQETGEILVANIDEI